jgi:hypothetical protein
LWAPARSSSYQNTFKGRAHRTLFKAGLGTATLVRIRRDGVVVAAGLFTKIPVVLPKD